MFLVKAGAREEQPVTGSYITFDVCLIVKSDKKNIYQKWNISVMDIPLRSTNKFDFVFGSVKIPRWCAHHGKEPLTLPHLHAMQFIE